MTKENTSLIKKGAGQPPHKPEELQIQTVIEMVRAGIPHEKIAKCLGIDAKTLRKHYREEIDTSSIIADTAIAESLFAQATTGNNVAAAIWWTKSRMGWKDSTVVENTIKGTLSIQSLLTEIDGTGHELPSAEDN